jgi:uncharacterized protein YkvS
MFVLVFLLGISSLTSVALPTVASHINGKQTELSKQSNPSLVALAISDITLEDSFIDEDVEDDEVTNHKTYISCNTAFEVLYRTTILKSIVNTNKKKNSVALFILNSALKIPFSI